MTNSSQVAKKTQIRLLTQNPHLAPSTQQAEQAGLTHEQIPKRASQFSEVDGSMNPLEELDDTTRGLEGLA
jgi:hypothetical protein